MGWAKLLLSLPRFGNNDPRVSMCLTKSAPMVTFALSYAVRGGPRLPQPFTAENVCVWCLFFSDLGCLRRLSIRCGVFVLVGLGLA